jgi:hypothetical protein
MDHDDRDCRTDGVTYPESTIIDAFRDTRSDR